MGEPGKWVRRAALAATVAASLAASVPSLTACGGGNGNDAPLELALRTSINAHLICQQPNGVCTDSVKSRRLLELEMAARRYNAALPVKPPTP